MHPPKINQLTSFEERAGFFHGLAKKDGMLVAHISTTYLSLPAELEQSLRPLIGQKVAILRTDIPDKQYLFRVLDQAPISEKNASLPEAP